jgi:hypothetical protein
MSADVLEKFAAKARLEPLDALAAEPEAVDDFTAFGFLRGVRDRALYLELRQKNGNLTALGYAWIERIEFDPSIGITLHALGQQIVIRGRNLNGEMRPGVRLVQGLTRQRVPWIQEADEPTAFQTPAHGVLVERIEL